MPKRKDADADTAKDILSEQRQKRASGHQSTVQQHNDPTSMTPTKKRRTTSRTKLTTPTRTHISGSSVDIDGSDMEDQQDTPRPSDQDLFATPSKQRNALQIHSRSQQADRSAKKKSALALALTGDEDDWDNSAALAREILADGEDSVEARREQAGTSEATPVAETPKRGRGRPKGAKNRRSPTPEGDLAPEERYFFQNRMAPPQVTNHIFSSLGLLNHDEFYTHVRRHNDDYDSEQLYLSKLHTRSFLQWRFELDQDYSVCVYGYGSKKPLLDKFTDWLYARLGTQPRIVVLNGYRERINIRAVLHTVGAALAGSGEQLKLAGQPHDMVDTILNYLASHAKRSLVMVIHSIDGPALRKPASQSVFARLASHPCVQMVVSADTPAFPILWSSALRDRFQFVFHDCTTFMSYKAETDAVDDVHELLGRKNRRVGGKEGITFVLKSLPENARNLYRVLLTEILTILGGELEFDQDDDNVTQGRQRKRTTASADGVGIEYRTLYQKASEEFIASSDINFRFLLKEFHDHQMLTSKRDASGTELLGVPLSKDDMEAVLEELVMG